MATRIKFTDSAIQKLSTPAGSRVEYTDEKITGLMLRVSPKGVKTFSLLRRLKSGTLERVTLGRFPEIKCEEAIRRANELIGVIAGGANPAEVRRALKAEPTFAEFFTEYLERHSKIRKRTSRDDEQKYRDFLARPLGKKKLSSINRTDLAAIHAAITKAGHPTGANRVKDLFSSVFSKAIEWGFLDSNPAAGISDNPEKSRSRFLQGNELSRLFLALEAEDNTVFRDYFLIALLTGARRTNVLSMRWPELDLERGEWRIPRTKNGNEQNVPLVPEAVAILKARKEATNSDATFVFPAKRGDSKHGHASGERKAWLRTLDRDEISQLRSRIEATGKSADGDADEHPAQALIRLRTLAKRLNVDTAGTRIEDIRPHDLRRTMGSWQARTGASMVIIGKSLGHKSQQATAVYARLDLDPVRAAMETATSAMLEAAKQKPSADVLSYKKRA